MEKKTDHLRKMNRAENMGSKQFQVKSGHLAAMDWEENMRSK